MAIKKDTEYVLLFEKYKKLVQNQIPIETIPANETLLLQGKISHYLYFIKKGALRLWHNDGDKDVTVQFFFENQMVSAFESLFLDTESLYSIESMEKTTVYKLDKQSIFKLMENTPEFQRDVLTFVCERFIAYQHYFLSRIKDSPEARYRDLVQHQPQIVERVSQHYIASYLGITPVSLSRIKNRQ
ncbi:Crp/Fnr family transcriptional regulator [Pediococcus siamensis]|uniref:Crp/Fnr family transcriptional regulator n=1 Tax=Pediococcus siamensis TaxID=381829 RepID=UPI0039A082D8